MKRFIFTFILIFAFCVFSFARNEKADCPKIIIEAPQGMMNVDEPIYFSVKPNNELEKLTAKYEWQIINGDIIEGQETPKIKIKPKSAGIKVDVAVKIAGLPNQCENTASEFVNITPPIIDVFPIDEYRKLTRKDELTRIDVFLTSLLADENFQGIIHIRASKIESNNAIKKHIQFMLKHFKFRKFPKERISFVIEKSDERRTTLWNFPEDFKFNLCEKCEILKGADL